MAPPPNLTDFVEMIGDYLKMFPDGSVEAKKLYDPLNDVMEGCETVESLYAQLSVPAAEVVEQDFQDNVEAAIMASLEASGEGDKVAKEDESTGSSNNNNGYAEDSQRERKATGNGIEAEAVSKSELDDEDDRCDALMDELESLNEQIEAITADDGETRKLLIEAFKAVGDAPDSLPTIQRQVELVRAVHASLGLPNISDAGGGDRTTSKPANKEEDEGEEEEAEGMFGSQPVPPALPGHPAPPAQPARRPPPPPPTPINPVAWHLQRVGRLLGPATTVPMQTSEVHGLVQNLRRFLMSLPTSSTGSAHDRLLGLATSDDSEPANENRRAYQLRFFALVRRFERALSGFFGGRAPQPTEVRGFENIADVFNDAMILITGSNNLGNLQRQWQRDQEDEEDRALMGRRQQSMKISKGGRGKKPG